MSRLRTIGFEVGGWDGVNNIDASFIEGQATGTTLPILETTTVFSGAQAIRCNGGAGAISSVRVELDAAEAAVGRNYFARVKFRMSALPSNDVRLLHFLNSAGTAYVALLYRNVDHKLELFDEVNVVDRGSSAATMAVDTWYTLELSCLINSGAADDSIEGRLDGVSIASIGSISLGTTAPVRCEMGWIATPGAGSKLCFVDDFILNDDQGTANNTWPGTTEKIVYLKPISDNQVGSWTGGAGGTTNLFDAVDNIPPTGTATETDLTQIENNLNGGGTNYIANLQSYTTGGLPAGATITAVQAFCCHGEDTASGVKTGQFKVASNPAGAFVAFTFGGTGGALGTFPSNWYGAPWGTAVDNPSVTVGTSPTIELDKTDTGTTVASVCALGLYVGYTEAVGGGGGFIIPWITAQATSVIGSAVSAFRRMLLSASKIRAYRTRRRQEMMVLSCLGSQDKSQA